MQTSDRKMRETMKPGEWGTRQLKPAIVWYRPGVAVRGEPSVFQEVRTYASEEERFDAHKRGLTRSAEDQDNQRKMGKMPKQVFHGTSGAFLEDMSENGISSPSYWTDSLEKAQEYASSYSDGVVLAVNVGDYDFDANMQII